MNPQDRDSVSRLTPAERKTRQRAREVAAVPQAVFERYLANAEQPSRAGLLRFAERDVAA